jgi:hypothetical protein
MGQVTVEVRSRSDSVGFECDEIVTLLPDSI